MRLARYLKEFVGLRSTTVYDLNRYESVLWFGDMPQEPECSSPAWNDGFEAGDPWLVVQKQQFPKPPEPPDIILPWMDPQSLRRAATQMPALRPTRFEPDLGAMIAEGEDAPLIELRLEDYPEIASAYHHYQPHWEAWAAEYLRRSRIQEVYAELFRLHTQVHKQGEIVELVLGLGLLTWRGPATGKSLTVLRHVVTARVDLHFDPATGIIRLEGAADGAQLRIEDDMLDAEFRPERSHYTSVNEQLSAIGDDIWDRSQMSAALKSWAGALHPDSEWFPGLKPGIGGSEKPVIAFAPALILRKRTQVGMVRIYESLIKRMSDTDEEVPAGWMGLIETVDDREPIESSTPSGEHPRDATLEPQEIYFPLLANREQRRIVEAISTRRGVLVQGPPGTGKSHTIANLVCHLLAIGKRVLITAETGRALKVLKEKLPEEIKPLCVSLLGQGGDAFAELNSAVQGITTRYAAWSPGAHDERIVEIDRDLDRTRRTLAAVDTELRSLRQDETYPHSLMSGAYSGTASAIARRVATERERIGWLQIPREATDEPPATRADMLAWLEILRRYDDDTVSKSALRIIGTDKLPRPADFAIAIATEKEAKEAVDRLAGLHAHAAYRSVSALIAADRLKLANALRQLIDQRRGLLRLGYEWLPVAVKEALGGRKARWQALLDQSLELVSVAEQLLGSLGSATVTVTAAKDVKAMRADAAAVIEHLSAGGRWSSFGLLTPKPVKERTYLREITVDGQPAETIARLLIVRDYLDLTLAISDLELAWSDHSGLPAAPQPKIRLAAIKEYLTNLSSGLEYAAACLTLAQHLSVIAPGSLEPDWLTTQAEEWLEILEAAEVAERHRQATERTTECLRDLRAVQEIHDVHPVVLRLIGAVQQREVTAYSQAYEEVSQIEQTRRDQELRQTTESALNAAAPGLVDVMGLSVSDRAWNSRFADWELAWRWAIADNWLGKRTDFDYANGYGNAGTKPMQ